MNKRAELGIFEIFFALVMVFAIAIFVIVLSYTWSEINTPLEVALNSAIPGNESAFNMTTMNSRVSGGIFLFNAMFPFIILGLIIFAIISAYLSRDNPVFLAVSVLILGVVILLGIVFANVFQNLTTNTALQSTADSFTIIKLFMNNLPIIIGVVAAATIFVLFSVGRKGSATGGL